jgi:hypothetical protein
MVVKVSISYAAVPTRLYEAKNNGRNRVHVSPVGVVPVAVS